MSRLARDAVLLGPSYVVPGLASLVMVALLFGILGPAGYGLFALIYAMAHGLPTLTTSWLEALTIRFAHREPYTASPLLLLGTSALSAAAALVLAALLIDPSVAVALATAVATAAIGAYLVGIARLQSALRFAAVSVIASFRSLLGLALTLIIAISTHEAVLVGVAMGLSFAMAALVALRSRPPASARAAPPGERSAHSTPRVTTARYAAASAVASVALVVLANGDRFVLASTHVLDEVGRYTATYTLLDLGFRLVPSIGIAAARPRLFQSWDAGSRAASVDRIEILAGLTAWLLASGLVVLVAGAPLVHVLPLPAGLVGPIGLGLGAFGVGFVLSLRLSAELRQERHAANLVAAAILSLVLDVLWIPRHGAIGAAVAMAVAYVAYAVLNALADDASAFSPAKPSGRLGLGAGAAATLAAVASLALDVRAPLLIAAGVIVVALAPVAVGLLMSRR